MKRSPSLPRHEGGGRSQFFDYGPLSFNVSKAIRLAGNAQKYQPQRRRPSHDWVEPGVTIDEQRAPRCDPSSPVLFASVVIDGMPARILIDGNHRVARALREGSEVAAIVLDLADTLKVVSGPPELLAGMRRNAEVLSNHGFHE